jgi:polyhydroxyalkanoate synthase
MLTSNSFLPDFDAQRLGAAMGETMKSLSGASVPPQTLQQLQREYVEAATALWNGALQAMIGDRRFAAEEWAQNPTAAYTAQMYLLNAAR